MSIAFQHYEARPCIQPADENLDVVSYTDEETFNEAMANALAEGFDFTFFWTIYGIDEEGLAHAIADIVDKAAVHTILRAMLAPLVEALNVLDDGTAEDARPVELKRRVTVASAILRDFVGACSNENSI